MLLCMCMLTKRTNILFDHATWNQLATIARARRTSVGVLVRDAVTERYLHGDFERIGRIQQACSSIEKYRKQVKGKLDYKELINYGRKQ